MIEFIIYLTFKNDCILHTVICFMVLFIYLFSIYIMFHLHMHATEYIQSSSVLH